MKISPNCVVSVRMLALVAMVVALGVEVLGQATGQAPPARSRVVLVQVKPEMARAWVEFQRTEVLPALKKAGVAWRWVYSHGGPVGDGFTYSVVTPVANYASFDDGPAIRKTMTPEAYTRYQDKERTMLVATSAVVQTLVQNASLVSGSSTPPPHAIVTTVQLLQGRGAEYAAITAADFLPALKKAGVTDYWVFATNFGGPAAQRTLVQPLAKWADLDAQPPLIRAIGAEGAQKLNQKRGALVASTSATVVTHVPELSYGAPPPPKR